MGCSVSAVKGWQEMVRVYLGLLTLMLLGGGAYQFLPSLFERRYYIWRTQARKWGVA
jgi:hypothetical protein